MTKPINPSAKLAPKYGEQWDAEQDERLRAMALSGVSRREAAELLGRTYMAIRGRSQALGLRFIRDSYGGLVRPYDVVTPSAYRDRLEDSNRRMLRALALAIHNGQHLPKGTARV